MEQKLFEGDACPSCRNHKLTDTGTRLECRNPLCPDVFGYDGEVVIL